MTCIAAVSHGVVGRNLVCDGWAFYVGPVITYDNARRLLKSSLARMEEKFVLFQSEVWQGKEEAAA